MIDKSLVKKRFSKSLVTYDDNAIIQKQMAERLIELLPDRRYENILEIGCATGILTRQIRDKILFNKFWANDIIADSKKYIDEIITENTFLEGDIEEIPIENKFDLIISNACLQWCNDFNLIMKKLLNALRSDGIVAVSVFGQENIKEVRSLFSIDNDCADFSDYDIKSEIKKIYFNSPKDVLRHLKLTGANALREYKLTKKALSEFEKEYKSKYCEGTKVYLTYNPVYIVIKKSDIE